MTMQMVRHGVKTQCTCRASRPTRKGDDRQPAASRNGIAPITDRCTCHTVTESWRADPSPPQAMGGEF